ncbi:MAG TPA: protease modulator HflK, partial [Thiobacillus sp.]
EGEASRFAQILTEYQKAPQVTRQRLYLDTMQTVMNNTSKVVVDQKGGNSLLYLPLDKLQQIVSQPYSGAPDLLSQAAPAPAIAPAATTPAPAESRSRDAFRSRERGERP